MTLSEIKARVKGHMVRPLHVEEWNDGRGLQIVAADNETMTAEYSAPEDYDLEPSDRANFELYASAPDLLALAEELERHLAEEQTARAKGTAALLKRAEAAESEVSRLRAELGKRESK